MLIDTHAHLDDRKLSSDLDGVLARAIQAGVRRVITVGTDPLSSEEAVRIADRHDMVSAVVGVHPHDAETIDDDVMRRIGDLAQSEHVVAIGETGLDFYRDLSPRDLQTRGFHRHIDLAIDRGLPLVVHCRDAWDACLEILEQRSGEGLRGVAHCFSGTPDHARRLCALGFMISFAGNVTYPNAGRLRDTAAKTSAESILVETDCPYLAPQSHRGRTNEPSYVVETAAALAEVYVLTEEDVARVTTRNAHRLFGVGDAADDGAIVYEIRGALYVNLTNRCSNACRFCPRETDFSVKGHSLKLDHEPSSKEITDAIGDPSRYTEIVFCGFGEPTLRLEVLKSVAQWVKSKSPGLRVRINTNGHGSLIHGRPICRELSALVDCVSVSLNSASREEYLPLCRPTYGPEAYDAMLAFVEEARNSLPEVVVTTLDRPGGDVEACRSLADKLGVPLRVRKYNDVGTLR
jgi:TatD DNase family protein